MKNEMTRKEFFEIENIRKEAVENNIRYLINTRINRNR